MSHLLKGTKDSRQNIASNLQSVQAEELSKMQNQGLLQ
jgi:hypothetical protein